MINLGCDIVLFKNILPEDLIINLLNIRKKSNSMERLNIHQHDMDVFYQFNTFWIKNIEEPMLDEYFKLYNVKEDKGFNVNENTIDSMRKYVSVKWRDVFLLNYSSEKTSRGEKDVHWDFSGLTTIGCLIDDYLGGELVFPRQNISVKLEKKDMIVFPGGITHPHYADCVTSGNREVIVGQSLTLQQDHWIIY